MIVFLLFGLTAFETWRLHDITNARTKEAVLQFLVSIIPEPNLSYLCPETQADPVGHSDEVFHHYMLKAEADINNRSKRSPSEYRPKCPTDEFSFSKYLDNLDLRIAALRHVEKDHDFLSWLDMLIESTVNDVVDRVRWIRRRSVSDLKKAERRRHKIMHCIAKQNGPMNTAEF